MSTIFIGDVHGCGDELEELLHTVAANRVVFVGDLFTKGPCPKKVWRLIQQVNGEAVLGNHDDWMIRNQKYLSLPQEAKQWLTNLPLRLEGESWVVVHAGVAPEGLLTSRKQSLVMRRWPDDSCTSHPFWWQLYRGKKLVIYGHDAARGLQDHRPYTLGLDTGCVYGNRLTAYLLEEDRIVHVAAKQVYRAVSKNSAKGK